MSSISPFSFSKICTDVPKALPISVQVCSLKTPSTNPNLAILIRVSIHISQLQTLIFRTDLSTGLVHQNMSCISFRKRLFCHKALQYLELENCDCGGVGHGLVGSGVDGLVGSGIDIGVGHRLVDSGVDRGVGHGLVGWFRH